MALLGSRVASLAGSCPVLSVGAVGAGVEGLGHWRTPRGRFDKSLAAEWRNIRCWQRLAHSLRWSDSEALRHGSSGRAATLRAVGLCDRHAQHAVLSCVGPYLYTLNCLCFLERDIGTVASWEIRPIVVGKACSPCTCHCQSSMLAERGGKCDPHR